MDYTYDKGFCRHVIGINRPLLKPHLSCKLVKQTARDQSQNLVLNYCNKDVNDESQKITKLPHTVHTLFKTSHYNMNRQINRYKKRCGISVVSDGLRDIEVLVPDLNDETGSKFSVEKSQFCFEQQNNDVYVKPLFLILLSLS